MSLTIPFLKWGDYHSQDDQNPDVLELQVVDIETFETELSTNVAVKQLINESWEDRILPLKSHDSTNHMLLQQWNIAKKEGRLKPGKKFKIHTHLGISKNRHAIRRYDLIF